MENLALVLGTLLCISFTWNILLLGNQAPIAILVSVYVILPGILIFLYQIYQHFIKAPVETLKAFTKSLVDWGYWLHSCISDLNELYKGWNSIASFPLEATLQTIGEEIKDAATKLTDSFHKLTIGLRDVIQHTTIFIFNKLRLCWRWLSSKIRNLENPDKLPTDQCELRTVFIVSLRSGLPYQAIKEYLKEPVAPRPNFDWMCHDITSIPSTMKLETSVRHFAVCLMPTSVQRDPRKSLTDKFEECTYWEILGTGAAPGDGDCVRWSTEKIQTIDTLLEVGVTTYDNNWLSQEIHRPLEPFWSHCDPLGWNSFDFALRFSCLIPCDTDTKALLRALGIRVLSVRRFEVISQISWLRQLRKSWWLFPVQIALTVFSTPLVLLAHCGYFVIVWLYYEMNPEDRRPRVEVRWEELSRKLEDMFPQLRGLVAY